MKKTIVINIKTSDPKAYDDRYVYIGRPSKWGNPFIITKHGSREEVLHKYLHYLDTHPELKAAAKLELKGKVLGCYCTPYACHGDYLAMLANGIAI